MNPAHSLTVLALLSSNPLCSPLCAVCLSQPNTDAQLTANETDQWPAQPDATTSPFTAMRQIGAVEIMR